MKKNYVKEMMDSGYTANAIDDFHKIALPYLGEKFFPDKTFKILDIGAGAGHSLVPLLEAGWKNLWAIDRDDYNKEFFKKRGIVFNSVDVTKDKFPFEPNFFDVILSFHLIEHLNDSQNYLEEVWRVLRPGGVLIIVTPDWRRQYKTFWRDHTHLHPFDKESISRILKSYNFTPVFIKNFGVFRGIGRTGLWKLYKPLIFSGVDMVAVAKKEI
jgi:SAM-dependent methyltransferase